MAPLQVTIQHNNIKQRLSGRGMWPQLPVRLFNASSDGRVTVSSRAMAYSCPSELADSLQLFGERRWAVRPAVQHLPWCMPG
eukprot:scaffold229170_cov27-Prasinocladus_malaysianus.AAC.1